MYIKLAPLAIHLAIGASYGLIWWMFEVGTLSSEGVSARLKWLGRKNTKLFSANFHQIELENYSMEATRLWYNICNSRRWELPICNRVAGDFNESHSIRALEIFHFTKFSRARFSAVRGWMGDDLCEKCGESETSHEAGWNSGMCTTGKPLRTHIVLDFQLLSPLCVHSSSWQLNYVIPHMCSAPSCAIEANYSWVLTF